VAPLRGALRALGNISFANTLPVAITSILGATRNLVRSIFPVIHMNRQPNPGPATGVGQPKRGIGQMENLIRIVFTVLLWALLSVAVIWLPAWWLRNNLISAKLGLPTLTLIESTGLSAK